MLHRNIDGFGQPTEKADRTATITMAFRAATFMLALILPEFLLSSAARAEADLQEELHCLALNIYFEARNQPELGQRAVGHVVLNRVQDKRFPGTICGVVQDGGNEKLHRCQFSWWCDGESDEPNNRKAWENSQFLAKFIYWGFSKDPTYGALWYHADYVRPVWRKAFLRGPGIGRHIFYLKTERKAAAADRKPAKTLVSQDEQSKGAGRISNRRQLEPSG